MIPEYNEGQEIYLEHMTRYGFAAQFVKNKVVLDIACGSGYGVSLLKKAGADKVIGVDISAETIDYCRDKYSDSLVEFHVGHVEKIPLKDHSVDVAVSFETIEHVNAAAQVKFLQEIRRVLRPHGIFVVSTPNSRVYPKGNAFHLKELDPQEFGAILRENFKHTTLHYQDDVVSSYVFSDEHGNVLVNRKPMSHPVAKISTETSMYLIAVCTSGSQIRAAEYVELSNIKPHDVLAAEIYKKDQVIQSKDKGLESRDKDIQQMEHQKAHTAQELVKLQSIIGSLEDRVSSLKGVIESAKHESSLVTSRLQSTEAELDQKKFQLSSTSNELAVVRNSRGWRAVLFTRMIFNKTLPKDTYRRKFVIASLKLITRKKDHFQHWRRLMSKTISHAHRKGLAQTITKIHERLSPGRDGNLVGRFIQSSFAGDPYNTNYYHWINGVESPFVARLQGDRECLMTSFSYKPKISVLMPTYNGDEIFFRKAVFSVINQWYENWELCIVDDHSSHLAVKMVLDELRARNDPRIKIEERAENGGISLATNQAAKLATGEYLAFIDHDDEIEPYSLALFVKELQKDPQIDVSYSDCDKISVNGYRYDPEFKPDWSPELLISVAYSSHFRIIRRKLYEKVGGLRKEFDGSQDYDLTLRITEYTDKVIHIPWVLYHWRAAPGSVALSSNEKPYAQDAGVRALQSAVVRRGIPGKAVLHPCAQNNGVHKIAFNQDLIKDKITILIPTKDAVSVLRTCISSIQRLTRYPHYEIVIINNNSEKPETLEYLKRSGVRVIDIPTKSFNFSYINNKAVQMVDSEYIVFLNNDTEVINPDWLLEMIGTMKIRKTIGVVGAKLLYPNETVQHAGVITVLEPDIIAHHAHLGLGRDDHGHCGFAVLLRNYSAVTAACMMVRKSLFTKLGGFNEDPLGESYNDVDFCLRVIRAGYSCVYNPDVLLYHRESHTKKRVSLPKEVDYLLKTWKPIYPIHDPFISRHFDKRRNDYTLEVNNDITQ